MARWLAEAWQGDVVTPALTVGNQGGTAVAAVDILKLGAGAVGTPSLRFSDATTGIYRPFANYLGFSLSGVDTMQFQAQGIDLGNAITIQWVASFGGSPNVAIGRVGVAAIGIGSAVSLADNTGDLGTSAQRVRTGYFGTSIINSGTYAATPTTTAVAVTNGGTISTAFSVSRIAPTAAVTSMAFTTGVNPGQLVIVTNESANLVTFSAAATSLVANGAGATVGATRASTFTWDGVSRWYQA